MSDDYAVLLVGCGVMRGALSFMGSISLVACAYGISSDDFAGTHAPPPSAPVQDAAIAPRDGASAIADASSDAADSAPDAAPDASIQLDAAPDGGGGSTWMTPTCDGVVSSVEYGGTANQLVTNGGQTWSVTWNASNLYVGVDGANLAEGVVVYVGFGLTGLAAGQAYDGTRPGSLTFKADGVAYAKQGYNEARVVTNSTWGNATANAITFCGKASTRELVIPWSAIGSVGVPSSFRWVGYATSASGFVYGQVPQTLPGGFVGTAASFPNDYFVASTNDGSGSFAFSKVE